MASLFLHPHLADPDDDFFFTRDVVDDAEFHHDHHDAKRRRIENLSRRYLQGHPMIIQSARLRGPFSHRKSTNVTERTAGQSHEVPQRRVPQRQKVEKLLRKHSSDHGDPSPAPRQVTPEVAAAAPTKESTHDWLRRLEPRADSPEADGNILRLEDRLDRLESHTPSKPSAPRSIENNPTVNHVLGSNDLRLCWNLKERKKDSRGIASDSLLDLYEFDDSVKARSNSQPTLTSIPLSLQANVDEHSVRPAPDAEHINDQTEPDVKMLDQLAESPRSNPPPDIKANDEAGHTKPKSERAPLTSRSAAFTIPLPSRRTSVIKIAEGQENAPYNGDKPKEPLARPQGFRRLSEPGRPNEKKKRTHALHASPTGFHSPFVYRKASDEEKPRSTAGKREKPKAATARFVEFGSSPLRVDDRELLDGQVQSPSKSEPIPEKNISVKPDTDAPDHKRLPQKNILDGLEGSGVAPKSLSQKNIPIEPEVKDVAHEIPFQEKLPDGPEVKDVAHRNPSQDKLPNGPEVKGVAHETVPQGNICNQPEENHVARDTMSPENFPDEVDANHMAHKSFSQEDILGNPGANELAQESLPHDFSTQAALVSAQRAFQQQLVSPAKRSDIYNLMDPISDSQNTTPPPTGPMPTFSPITPFRMVNQEPKSTEKSPTSAAPPVSTQDLFNAASPFAFSTVKKPKPRKRVSIGIESLLNPQLRGPEQATPCTNSKGANANADGDTTVADPSTMFAPADVNMVDTGTPALSPSHDRSFPLQSTPSWTPINKPASQPSPSKSTSASPLLYHHHRVQQTPAPPSSTAPPTIYHFSLSASQQSNNSVSASSSSTRGRRTRQGQGQGRRSNATNNTNSNANTNTSASRSIMSVPPPSQQTQSAAPPLSLPDAQQVSGNALLGDDEVVDIDAVVEAADSFLSTWDWRRDLAGVRAA
ncbi:hypothetical protein IWX49DRAFT_590197 [Phyllosticta citricarpa]|uniref:Uncharacterized protein n=2 Tax=Phyllosticta TaxID=121621 RepID=A0ABR1LBP9_9PEZI